MKNKKIHKQSKFKTLSTALLLALGGGAIANQLHGQAHADTIHNTPTTSKASMHQTKAFFNKLNADHPDGMDMQTDQAIHNLEAKPTVNSSYNKPTKSVASVATQSSVTSQAQSSSASININQNDIKPVVQRHTTPISAKASVTSTQQLQSTQSASQSIQPKAQSQSETKVSAQSNQSQGTHYSMSINYATDKLEKVAVPTSVASSKATSQANNHTSMSLDYATDKLVPVSATSSASSSSAPTSNQASSSVNTTSQHQSHNPYKALIKQANQAGQQKINAKDATHYGYRNAFNNTVQQNLANNPDYKANENNQKLANQAQKSDLKAVNNIRAKAGLKALTINPSLQKEAQATATYLHNNTFLHSHETPAILPNENTNEDTHNETPYNNKLLRNAKNESGTKLGKSMLNNYIHLTNNQTYNSFKNNILDPYYTNIGVGYYYDSKTHKFNQVTYYGGGKQMRTPSSQVPRTVVNDRNGHTTTVGNRRPYLSPIQQAKIAYPWTPKSIHKFMQQHPNLKTASTMNSPLAQQAHNSELTYLNRIRAKYHVAPLKLAYNNQIVADLDNRSTFNIYSTLRTYYGWRSAHGASTDSSSNPNRNSPIVAKNLGQLKNYQGYGENAGAFSKGTPDLDGTRYKVNNGKQAAYAVIDSMTAHDVFSKPDGTTEENGHLKDIINPKHKYVGISYIYDPKTNYGTEVDYFTDTPLSTPTAKSTASANSNTTQAIK